MKKYQLFINGEIKASGSNKYFDAVNPSDGEVFAQVADATVADMKTAIEVARASFDHGAWSRLSVKERGKYLISIAQKIREYSKELAELETLDVGKTTKHATFIDVPTCADTFEYFGNIALDLEKEINVAAPVKSTLLREPVGVVGCIIPWNYPLIMFGWKVAPALIAGNTVIFKPSSQASVSTARLAEIINETGLPKGVFNFITSRDHNVTAELISSTLVDKISFTGGTETGKEVMRFAALNTKKLTLELGGKSPNIVFADCDFDAALGGTMSAIFMNQGQMCTAGSRLLLEDKIYDKFLLALVERTKKLKVGDARDYSTDFGPLANEQQLQNVLNFVQKGSAQGAKLMCGGKRAVVQGREKGFYIEPTIFADVDNSMAIAQEEIFGPVLAVIKFSGEDEAVKIANDTKFGLAACVWSRDLDKANRVAKKIKAGTVWVNTYGGFYNEAPFGGYKQSGMGRELGLEGLFEYTQVKHVCVDKTPGGMPLAASWF
ncbi:MAG TPA: aldehyde dehydrogenase family protein [Candidatus Omnitrophota bacterium]|nr:aldehyde dehydrogenase family protein [Candidatus Omnitrophota bacterium]HPD85528.1 aldehyde dehydrogenase family protein [Candidatus Omnitrophota bacterium]HRZ04432.1 aldehyde dehydrogenase family protein [Candidatus Omnitrophota bacterium]